MPKPVRTIKRSAGKSSLSPAVLARAVKKAGESEKTGVSKKASAMSLRITQLVRQPSVIQREH